MTREQDWISSQFPAGYQGYAVECGAWDGHEGSHTVQLEEQGWKVLCVEPIPSCEMFLKERRAIYRMCAASDHEAKAEPLYIYTKGAPGFTSLRPTLDHPVCHPEPGALWEIVDVEVRTLTSLLREVGFPRLDLAVIDTEGTELDVLHGLDFVNFRPRALIVESWDDLSPVCVYLTDQGYRRLERIGVNDCFVYEALTRAPA